MRKNDKYYYLAEGECEKKLIETFKEQKNLIVAGKVSHFNVIQDHITPAFLRTISEGTTMILVFDTDTNNTEILLENIALLNAHSHIKEVWCVLQVKNLEDEFKRSTNITEVKQLTGSRSNKDYKHALIKEKRLFEKLKNHNFDFSKFWVTSPTGVFKALSNDGLKIKL